MSASNKFLIFAVALLVAVIGYLAVDHLERTTAPAPQQAASQSAGPAPTTPAPAPAAPAPATAAPPAAATDEATVRQAYSECVSGLFPTQADAQLRAAACSKALQTRRLKPDEIALARLTRGIARTALGDKALAGEDYIEAVQRYDRLIDPANPDSLALYRRAVALDASGQPDRALEDYSAAIKADPKSSFAFLGRGVLLAVRKRAYDRAIEDFDKVLALEPDNVTALVSRGDAFSQLSDFGRAMADLNRAVALAPDNPTVLVTRGQTESRRGNVAAAVRDYEAALKLDPRYAAAMVNLAAIRATQGQYGAAVELLDRAIAIDPRNQLAFYNRGYAEFALKQYDKAIADYSAAIAIDPNMGLAYNNRALNRAIAGSDLVAALADSDQALKLLPLNLEVRDTRGFIYLKLGDPALALNEYNAALTIDPNRALSLYGRGLARIRMGDANGKGDQEAAATINPEVANDFSIYGLK
ncbi:MAG: tetratricopeptide repeat protein [Rhodospirillales bacterium]|nr:tetratricopeptide repeat protein [Rhodospirillales bacterium]